jgi:hypothetical protein
MYKVRFAPIGDNCCKLCDVRKVGCHDVDNCAKWREHIRIQDIERAEKTISYSNFKGRAKGF